MSETQNKSDAFSARKESSVLDSVSSLVSELYELTDPRNVREKIEELSNKLRDSIKVNERLESENGSLKARIKELEQELGVTPSGDSDTELATAVRSITTKSSSRIEQCTVAHASEQIAESLTTRLVNLTESMSKMKSEHDGLLQKWREKMEVMDVRHYVDQYSAMDRQQLAAELDRHKKIIHSVHQLMLDPHQVQLKDESEHLLNQIVPWLRHSFRTCFGPTHSIRHGYFVDRQMAQIIHAYGYWVDYFQGHHQLDGHESHVFSPKITSDGRYLYTCSRDRTVICWDLKYHCSIHQWKPSGVGCIVLSDGIVITTGAGGDYSIRIWDASNHRLIRKLRGHRSNVLSLDISKDGHFIISGSTDGTLREWSVDSGDCVRVLNGHSDFVRRVLYIGDSWILSCSKDCSLRKWDRMTGLSTDIIKEGIDEDVLDCAINCDESWVSCALLRKIMVFEWPSMILRLEVVCTPITVCFHPLFPHILAVGMRDHSVEILNAETGRSLADFDGHTAAVRGLCFTPDCTRLVSTAEDSSCRVWDLTMVSDRFILKKTESEV